MPYPGDKREQRVSVVCGESWAPRLVADAMADSFCRRSLSRIGARDGAEAARGAETHCNVAPAAPNHVDAAAIAQLLAAAQGDAVTRVTEPRVMR